MVPKLHGRGQSFKGVSAYLFHDKGHAQSSERVAWVKSLNLWSPHPEDAWFEMMQTWQDRTSLKRAAGVKLTGRDNTKPVLHLSLSWHEQDAPTPQQQHEAALGALKVLGLQEHQALVIAHRDEPHPHVHLLVNTVHPFTGKTATLNFSKDELSRWADAYQREHGQQHCPQRQENIARRDELRRERAAERVKEEFAAKAQQPAPPKKPFEPVKDRSPNRRVWLEKAAVVERMKAMHSELSQEQKHESGALWRSHQSARAVLLKSAEARVAAVTTQQKEHFRPRWSGLYRNQKTEVRYLNKECTHPFERAAFVFRNRERLAAPGKKLGFMEMVGLITSPKRLMKAVEASHERDRRTLSHEQSAETKVMTTRIMTAHRAEVHGLDARQKTERAAQREHHDAERKEVTFQKAKADLVQHPPELANEPTPQFKEAAQPVKETPSERVARIKRDVIESRNRTGGRGDFEREI